MVKRESALPGFFYFIPNRTLAEIVDNGKLLRNSLPAPMAEVLRDVERVPEDASAADIRAHGPGEQPGVMLAPKTKHFGGAPALNKPGKQEWHDTEEGYFIGWEELPTALHLERLEMVR